MTMSLVNRRDVSGDAIAIHSNTQTRAMASFDDRAFPDAERLYTRSWATGIVTACKLQNVAILLYVR